MSPAKNIYRALGLIACYLLCIGNIAQAGVWEVISDPRQSDQALEKAIAQLPRSPSEPRNFWTTIINNPAFDAAHRRKCLIQLFIRHAKGASLAEIVRWPGAQNWFNKELINVHTGGYYGPSPFGNNIAPDNFCILALDLPKGNKSAIMLHYQHFMTTDALQAAFASGKLKMDNKVDAVKAIEFLETGETKEWLTN